MRLVLVGGGHAHLRVLEELSKGGWSGAEVTLVSMHRHHHYSGMVPGLLEGRYEEPQLRFDLAALARSTGVRFVEDSALRIEVSGDRSGGLVELEGGRIPFDRASLDVGSVPVGRSLPGVAEHAFSVRPMSRVVELVAALDRRVAATAGGGEVRAVVVGAGAAGVEVALAIEARITRRGRRPVVVLMDAGPRILPAFEARVRRRAEEILAGRGIRVRTGVRVRGVEPDGVRVAAGDRPLTETEGRTPAEGRSSAMDPRPGRDSSPGSEPLSGSEPRPGSEPAPAREATPAREPTPSGASSPASDSSSSGEHSSGAKGSDDGGGLPGEEHLPADLTVWMTGAAPPPLLAESGHPLSADGFFLVDSELRAVDGSPVWGAGDCIALRSYPEMPRAGVYAVRQGPVLARNLGQAMGAARGGSEEYEAKRYEPQESFLALLNTGDDRALLRWWKLVAHARWGFWLKDRIDRRFMAKYQALADSNHG